MAEEKRNMDNKTDEETGSPIAYIICHFDFYPYNFQQNFLEDCASQKRICGLFSRQSGKTECIALYCIWEAMTTKDISILIVAPIQRQSSELFQRLRLWINRNNQIKNSLLNETQTQIVFKNGSRIQSLPAGRDGATIRGKTADILIMEEAGYIKDSIVNEVLMPMIASKPGGKIIKIGTGKRKNHFYESCFGNKSNYILHCYDYQIMLKEGIYTEEFIKEQQETLTDMEFQTEYGAKFIEDADCYFSQELIESCTEDYPIINKNEIY